MSQSDQVDSGSKKPRSVSAQKNNKTNHHQENIINESQDKANVWKIFITNVSWASFTAIFLGFFASCAAIIIWGNENNVRTIADAVVRATDTNWITGLVSIITVISGSGAVIWKKSNSRLQKELRNKDVLIEQLQNQNKRSQ